ncbi:hypothetical protein SteCoe_9855 [Stentor coeruleus]|uniref:Uncharacterized protein n=1 Tax=Stentor coeruleus TaxID=5963 RepID=A0A1R2CH00_9CILI|nr:hypothetical protein SteCoe_9855 [Stentor coeruleus]
MDLVKNTIEFNKKLEQIRKYTSQYTETVEILRLKSRKKICVSKPANSWTNPYVGIHVQYATELGPRKRGRPSKDFEPDLANLKPGTQLFTCLSCSRQLELKKKYAKGQCQACYKRNKKVEENGIKIL